MGRERWVLVATGADAGVLWVSAAAWFGLGIVGMVGLVRSGRPRSDLGCIVLFALASAWAATTILLIAVAYWRGLD